MDIETGRFHLAVSLTIPAPPPTVWNVLTDPAAILEWFGPDVTLDPGPGGAFREVWQEAEGDEMVTTGTITHWEPPGRMVLSWKNADWPAATVVEIALSEPADGRTLLRLEHSGWDSLPEERIDALIADHTAGWSIHLRDLSACVRRQRAA